MCGVTGIFSLTGRPIDNAEVRIRRMTDLLHHRGPDASGVKVIDGGLVALGNTRLAITGPDDPIDLPTHSQDGRGVITFNGEIYDFLDQRRRLEQAGVSFRSDTDTEVLVEGMRRQGEDFLRDLDGMWAFAYYDREARSLILSRDLLGERHLFYRIVDDELVFASEALPVVADNGHSGSIDFAAMVCALRYGTPPPGQSIVEGVKRLRPGHNIQVTIGGELKEYRHLRLHPEKWADFLAAGPSEDAIIDQFEDLMTEQSMRRVPPHVPFVSTLSGGLDSALVVAFSSDFGKRTINTIYGQSEEMPGQNLAGELDEFEASKVTSARLGTIHSHIHMNNDDCIPVLKHIAENAFEGMLDAGVAPFEMLAWKIRELDRKVMLISDGPDELLGGYGVDRKAYQIDLMRRQQPWKYAALKAFSWKYRGRRIMSQMGFGGAIIPPGYATSPFHFVPQHQYIGPDILSRVADASLVDAAAGHYGVLDPAYEDIAAEHGYDETQIRAFAYAATSLPDMFNLRTDKAFLQASVESRLPFQAVKAVEFMIAMPAAMRFGAGDTTKHLMRTVVERHIGPEVSRRSKHGFSAQLFDSPNVWKAMKFEETIGDSSIFSDLPFKPGTREKIMTKPFRKFVWPMYVLTKLHDQLCSGVFSSQPLQSEAAQ